MVVARPARPQPAATPTLASFGLTAVRCACCGANICGVRHSCTRCNATVDEACMARVSTEVHCFTCTCRACRRALSGHLVQCRKCNLRVHGECTTDGLCTLCSTACASSGTRYNVIVPYHASCHRCDLAFKAAMQLDHAFLDLLADTLQSAASFWNNAPSRLKTLQVVAQSLEAACTLPLGI